MIGIRATLPSDEEFLWRMLFYASHSNDEPGVEVDDIRSNPDLVGYIAGWRDMGHLGVVAEDTRPIGAAWLRSLGAEDSTNPVFVDVETPELAVAVEPGMEGRGIGSTMIRSVLDEAAGRGVPAVVLSARADNPAVLLYERLGFEVVGEMVNRVGTGSVRMRATLPQGSRNGTGSVRA